MKTGGCPQFSLNKNNFLDLIGMFWFLLVVWGVSLFSEELKDFCVKKGNLTIFGWLLVIFSVLITWFVIWHMFKENRWRKSISILATSAIAIFMGFSITMTLETEIILKITNKIGLGIFGLCVIMGLLGTLILALILFGAARTFFLSFHKKNR